MIVETAIVQMLLADAAVAALIGTRLYPQDAPQDGARPLVLYATSDPDRLPTMTGYLTLQSKAFRFDCYGGDSGGRYLSAKNVADAIEDKLYGFAKGTITYGAETLNVQLIEPDGGEDGLEPPVHGDEEGLDYVGVGCRVHWND